MPWLEVETKINVYKPKVMREKIKKIANFVKKEKKGDDYFALKKGKGKKYPKKAFRLRHKPDSIEVNFKKWKKKYWSDDIVVKQEFEFVLKGKEEVEDMLALFRDLGFKEWMKKRKTSEEYVWKKDKNMHIELNKVEHLGWYVEIEYLCQPKDLRKAKKKIRKVFKELNINKKNIDNTGYTKMLWDRGIKDKRYFMENNKKKI
jgi:predicted adenylyl cyclase CyaB